MSEFREILVVHDPRFREHVPPHRHPERPERLLAVDAALAARGSRLVEVAPRAATRAELLATHSADYLDALEAIGGRRGQLDADTYYSPRTLEVAKLAAGGLVELALRVAGGEAKSAFAALRPPGHHAERQAAMGFCLLNNVAVAAQSLRAHGVERIAIVDWDVHHGNGTQHAFERERDVLFASLHQFPFYPGTGALEEQGAERGLGTTVNLPLPEGSDDRVYGIAFDEVLVPILRAFRPEFLLVSAGFDAHGADPLGGMNVSTHGFARMAERARAVADELCDGKLVLALEGGYELAALAESVGAVLDVLAAPDPPFHEFPRPSPSGVEVGARLRDAHAVHWRELARRTYG